MDWTNEAVLRFLELYRMNTCIWDPKHPSYKNRSRVLAGWNDIKDKLEFPGTLKELKKKRESLMSAYRGYKMKIHRTSKGLDDELYQPTWFAFELMDSFLGSVYSCKDSVNNEDDRKRKHDLTKKFINYDLSGDSDPLADGDISNTEDESISHITYQLEPVKRRPSTSQEISVTPIKIPKPETPVSQTDQRLIEDEECTIFGNLIAKKLLRLPVDRRDLLMIKIHELIYAESQDHNVTQ